MKKGEKNTAYDKLRQDVDQGSLEKLYLFYGEESYLKEHYRDRIFSLIGGEAFAQFNQVVLDGDSLTLDDLVDSVESLPVMSEKKLILIRDLNLSRPPVGLREQLPEILENLPDTLCMILYFDALEYKPDKRLKTWQAALKAGQAVEFAKAPQGELTAWIKRRFAALGKEIDSGECEYLTFVCGSLMTNLASEIDKIAAGTMEKRIDRQAIDQLASRALEAQIYQLTDYISKGDTVAAIRTLRDLLALKFEPVVLAGSIGKQVQKLYAAKLAQQAGLGESALMELFHMRSSYPAKLLRQAAGKRSLPWLRRALLLCDQADKELKSNTPDDARVLELLLLRMAAEKERVS